MSQVGQIRKDHAAPNYGSFDCWRINVFSTLVLYLLEKILCKCIDDLFFEDDFCDFLHDPNGTHLTGWKRVHCIHFFLTEPPSHGATGA